MTTLAGVLTTIQAAAGGVTGIKFAPTYPPDDAGDFPFVVTYPVRYRGNVNTPEDFRMLYDIQVELHIARKDMPEDVQTLLAYPEAVANAIFKACRDNAYAHAGIEGGFGGMAWGDPEVPTLGFIWTIKEVKVITAIT